MNVELRTEVTENGPQQIPVDIDKDKRHASQVELVGHAERAFKLYDLALSLEDVDNKTNLFGLCSALAAFNPDADTLDLFRELRKDVGKVSQGLHERIETLL